MSTSLSKEFTAEELKQFFQSTNFSVATKDNFKNCDIDGGALFALSKKDIGKLAGNYNDGIRLFTIVNQQKQIASSKLNCHFYPWLIN